MRRRLSGSRSSKTARNLATTSNGSKKTSVSIPSYLADLSLTANNLVNGGQSKVTLPATLAPGNYLIRHEIIGLHQAHTRGAAEFFPSCAQLRVGGNQSGKPAPEDLVRFPGAYSASHGGILLNVILIFPCLESIS